MNISRTTAFTLLEILIASIIFIISIAGLFATLSAVRQPVAQKERELTAAIMGQQFLESLRSEVSASNYKNGSVNGDLALGGPYSKSENDPNDSTVQYNLSWIVSCADGSTDCDQTDVGRRVDLNINFPDVP